MPRQVRIEFPGAFYHVMARGNRLDPIFRGDDGQDQKLWLKTLGEACERCEFRVWAWVLMRNHYHLVLETPKANLVEGMGWMQNAYTRRFNARHRQWGRLFGDRYKSILIDEGTAAGGTSYLQTVLDYVHLNPVRAGLISPKNDQSVMDYPWSSAGDGYALSQGKRTEWLAAVDGMALFSLKDTVAGRRNFVRRLDERAAAEGSEKSGMEKIKGQTLNSSLQRGWYWGSEAFKESMLELLNRRKKSEEGLPTSRNYASSTQGASIREKEAEEIIEHGRMHFGFEGLSREKIAEMNVQRGDMRMLAVAWALRKRTTVSLGWIAQRLGLRSAANAGQRVRMFDKLPQHEQNEQVRLWRKSF